MIEEHEEIDDGDDDDDDDDENGDDEDGDNEEQTEPVAAPSEFIYLFLFFP